MAKTFDAIVVGARFAGSPTAMLLARNGYNVLLLDRATFPSDTISTHLVHPPSFYALQRWGLLVQVASHLCPAYSHYASTSVRSRSPERPALTERLAYGRATG